MNNAQTPDTGYSIDLGNAASRNAYGWAKKTFATRAGRPGEPAQDLDGGFSNEIRFGQERLGISSDGIGTKIELAERLDKYDTLGYDLVAMTADDLIAAGFVPTNLSNIIDVNTIDYDVVDELMRGLHDACQFSKIAITGGEIAELGSRIGGFPGAKMNFNWASTAIGVLHPSLAQPLSGATAQAGDAVVALRSPSFRSNGYSLARKTLQRLFGDNWHNAPYDGNEELGMRNEEFPNDNSSFLIPNSSLPKTWGEALLAPSLIYAPALTAVLDAGLPLRGAAHITGGGVADNFAARHAAPLRNRWHLGRNRLPLLEHGERDAARHAPRSRRSPGAAARPKRLPGPGGRLPHRQAGRGAARRGRGVEVCVVTFE